MRFFRSLRSPRTTGRFRGGLKIFIVGCGGGDPRSRHISQQQKADKVVHPANECLKKTLELAAAMLELADAGDAAREDVGCGVVYGVLRDSGYKLKKLAEEEREKHLRQNRWQDEDTGPEDRPNPAKLTGDKGY